MNGIPLETLVPNKGHYYDSNPSLSELSPAVAALPAPPAIFSEAYRQIKAESTWHSGQMARLGEKTTKQFQKEHVGPKNMSIKGNLKIIWNVEKQKGYFSLIKIKAKVKESFVIIVFA